MDNILNFRKNKDNFKTTDLLVSDLFEAVPCDTLQLRCFVRNELPISQPTFDRYYKKSVNDIPTGILQDIMSFINEYIGSNYWSLEKLESIQKEQLAKEFNLKKL